MRRYIQIIEDAQHLGWESLWNESFCAAVQSYIERNLSDWSDDFAPDKLAHMVRDMLNIIWREAGDGSRLHIYRAELRPSTEIDAGDFGNSVGQFWSWYYDSAQVCHHDNGYDEHGGREGLETIVFVGSVEMVDVNWVATIAKNFILKGEREITVNDGAAIAIEEVHNNSSGDAISAFQSTMHVRSNGHEDDF